MGKDLYDQFAHARTRYKQANDILGFDLAHASFEGSEDELRQTRVTQPALYVHSTILAELLSEHGVKPVAAAGHSLGEYSALAASNAFSFEDGLHLVKARAEAMQLAGQTNPGSMAAIVGLSDEKLQELCASVSELGIVVPANFNSPGQVVISGSIPGVRKAVELAASMGAKLAKELNVSGAFHSPLMQPALDPFRKALETVTFSMPVCPVISNVTGKAHESVAQMRNLLVEQLLSPVQWTNSMLRLAETDAERWLEIGSGNVLSGLLKRIVKGAMAKSISSSVDIEQVAGALNV
jgi:[acyl-carrier-protein] S-malonyltransferase